MAAIQPENLEEFQNALMVITDYLKTYGEIFFLILPRQRREAIENDYEVTIERHKFLSEKIRSNINTYFAKHLEKCINELNTKFKALKQLQ
jgi:hypothetical protein